VGQITASYVKRKGFEPGVLPSWERMVKGLSRPYLEHRKYIGKMEDLVP